VFRATDVQAAIDAVAQAFEAARVHENPALLRAAFIALGCSRTTARQLFAADLMHERRKTAKRKASSNI
jgi:hypothetical protein